MPKGREGRGEKEGRGGGVRFFRKQPRKRQKHELQKKLGMERDTELY